MPESPADFAFCPHDRGPGIAVCLRCRADAHRKAAASRRRLATRAGIAALGVLVLAVAANSAVAARGATVRQGRAVSTSTSASTSTVDAGAGPGRSETFQVSQAGVSDAPAMPAKAAPATDPARAPLVDAGRTDLQKGRYVERGGDSITVHFDTPAFRTRRRDKFEQVVRGTLPAIYGAVADSVLAAVPDGQLAISGDLLADLPVQGIRLPVHEGWAITLWPGTRPGQDGPLVVSYRASLTRTQ